MIKNESGAFFIDSLIAFMIFISLILSFLTVPEVLVKKQELDYATRNVVRKIERDGMAGSSIWQTINELRAETGMVADFTWDGPFYGPDARIQIRDRFTVSAHYTVKVRLFEPTFTAPVYINIPIQKTLSGVSEVYWK